MNQRGDTIKSLFAPVRDGRLFHQVAASAAKRWVGILLALYALTTDGLTGWHSMGFAMRGLLDEPAHLATALVVLGALSRACGSRLDQRFGWSMLACAVLIDLDHVPAEFQAGAFTNDTPRPYTHALWTVITLTVAWAIALFIRTRAGQRGPATVELILAGAAWGVSAHFVRDIATAPMSFWWPVTNIAVEVPYWWYVLALAVIIGIGPTRRRSRPVDVASSRTAPTDSTSSPAVLPISHRPRWLRSPAKEAISYGPAPVPAAQPAQLLHDSPKRRIYR